MISTNQMSNNTVIIALLEINRSSPSGVFLRKGVLKICSKFTEHTCQSVISIQLQNNFTEIALRHGCSCKFAVYFRTLFP